MNVRPYAEQQPGVLPLSSADSHRAGGLQAHVRELQQLLEVGPGGEPERPVAVSRRMRDVIHRAKRFARSSATILLTGESGTGKEVLAKWIHHCSPRADQPYIRVNCAALPESLMESELFGHQRGAFTGALESRRGYLASAEGGTILLDEISEIPVALQAKLLRVLEEQEFQPVGSDQVLRMQARVIATSNRSLEQAVRAGTLREDLFYRLNVLQLELPPLRYRPEDVAPLLDHFIRVFQHESEQGIRGVEDAALKMLEGYPWPGNVRQLRNLTHRACVLNDTGILRCDDLALPANADLHSTDPSSALAGRRLDELERLAIGESLRRHAGNKAAAARELGVTARTLANKLRLYRQPEAA